LLVSGQKTSYLKRINSYPEEWLAERRRPFSLRPEWRLNKLRDIQSGPASWNFRLIELIDELKIGVVNWIKQLPLKLGAKPDRIKKGRD
jgi:hypothetical protein